MSDFDINHFNAKLIADFRAGAGAVGGNFEGVPLLILHTTGARSGEERLAPVTYLLDGERIVVFASKSGADSNPDWYRNLVVHPRVTVEMGTETFAAEAVELTGAERDDVYARQVAAMPVFADYQASTTRVIPVVALDRIG